MLFRNFPIRIYPGGTGGKMIYSKILGACYLTSFDMCGAYRHSEVCFWVYTPIFLQLLRTYGDMIYGYPTPGRGEN